MKAHTSHCQISKPGYQPMQAAWAIDSLRLNLAEGFSEGCFG